MNHINIKIKLIFSLTLLFFGIVGDGKNVFFVSGAWQGDVFHISPAGKKSLILDLGKAKTITVDIEYTPSQKFLLIPMHYLKKTT